MKPAYDILSWFLTQAIFTFVVQPFLYLNLPASIKVWSRVYFYGVFAAAVAMGFLNSPLKGMLAKKVKARSGGKPGLERAVSASDVDAYDMASTLGLPHDPDFSMQQIINGVKEEVEARKRRGSTVPDLKILAQQKLDEFRRDQQAGRKTAIDGWNNTKKSQGASTGVQVHVDGTNVGSTVH